MSSINLGEHQGDGIRYSMHLSAPAGGAAQMLRDPEGNWVGYAEYAALQAEVERLKEAWVDKKMQEDRDFLLQQVERLRKAGDAMEHWIAWECESPAGGADAARDAWEAAKGGQP